MSAAAVRREGPVDTFSAKVETLRAEIEAAITDAFSAGLATARGETKDRLSSARVLFKKLEAMHGTRERPCFDGCVFREVRAWLDAS